jgi:hypothetical protein
MNKLAAFCFSLLLSASATASEWRAIYECHSDSGQLVIDEHIVDSTRMQFVIQGTAAIRYIAQFGVNAGLRLERNNQELIATATKKDFAISQGRYSDFAMMSMNRVVLLPKWNEARFLRFVLNVEPPRTIDWTFRNCRRR